MLGESIVKEKNDPGALELRETMIYAGGKQIAERRIKYPGTSALQEATFLITLDPGGTERWEKFIDVQNYQFERDEGYDILDPFGAGVGYDNPYPTEPPSPNDPNADCDYTDHGHGEQEPYNCTLPDDFDDQSDEDSQVGSIAKKTYYLDGIEVNQDDAQYFLKMEMAVQCPNNECGPQTYENHGHYALSSPFKAYADGTSGRFVPRYNNNQVIIDGKTTNYAPSIDGYDFVADTSPFLLGIETLDRIPAKTKGEIVSNPKCPPENRFKVFFGNTDNLSVYQKAFELSVKNKREEGGWIYMDNKGHLTAVLKDRDAFKNDIQNFGKKDPDSQTKIVLADPPEIEGQLVVGNFHTHDVGGDIGGVPSEYIPGFIMGDVRVNNEISKVPGTIISPRVNPPPESSSDYAVDVYGPNRGFMKIGLPANCK